MPEGFSPPRVKVCGLTRPEDAAVAVDAGAEAIGFVAWQDSPRHVSAGKVASLVQGLPHGVCSVGVMVQINPDAGLAWAEIAGVDALQLCGEQNASDWKDFPLPLLRRVAVEKGAQESLEAWFEIADAFVLDHPSSPGGSGQEVEHSIAASLVDCAPCILAGGLTPQCVVEAIREVCPVGVDASSGLEIKPGIKDAEKVTSFVTLALEAL